MWEDKTKLKERKGKQLSHRLGTETVKCMTKLCPTWNMRSFWNRGKEEAINILTQFNFQLKIHYIFSNLKMSLLTLHGGPPLPYHHSFLFSSWRKVQWPLAGNQLIFIQAWGKEWEECIDVCIQATALWVPETPDNKEWTLGELSRPHGTQLQHMVLLCNKIATTTSISEIDECN